jgi:hypothetical protein
MSLYGSIKEVQNTVEKFYLKLEQRFSENKLISKLWGQMAQDLSQQINSLNELPKSFWVRLQKDQRQLIETIQAGIKPQDLEIKRDISLSDCIDTAIQSEEAIILKIYVPIIRNLRKNWTGQALDFYIMVKAHTVRIKRIAQSFSGDPVVMQHSNLLFQEFEKEIQEPDAEVIEKIKLARKSRTVEAKRPEKPEPKTKTKAPAKTKAKPAARAKPKQKTKVQVKTKSKTRTNVKQKPKTKPAPPAGKKPKAQSTKKKIPKQGQSTTSRPKIRRSHTKPLVEKTDLRRRRARR